MGVIVYRLCDPLFWVVLISGIAVWRMRAACTERRGRYRLLVVSWVAIWLATIPATAHLFQWILERENPPVAERPDGIDSIVVLGGGSLEGVPGSPSSRLTESTSRRTLRGAELYREGPPCPIVVCGGIVRPDEVSRSEASIMRELLLLVGVPDEMIVMDESSRNTWENSGSAQRILEERSLQHPALVTDAYHLPRALACFRARGLDVVPVGSGYRVYQASLQPLSFLPSSPAPLQTYYALHEMLGFAAYKLRGRY